MNKNHQVIFISHGGGPLPLLGDPGHDELVQHLKSLGSKLNQPDAILVISAHWEEPVVTITSNPNPDLIYDYYGFPDEAYDIKYPAPGSPDLAKSLHQAFQKNNMSSTLDDERGFDHGMFVPLKLLYPDASIPVVQLSLLNSLDPTAHLRLGQVIGEFLENTEQQNLLVIGSGFTFHNLREFMKVSGDTQTMNHEFEDWLIDTMSNPDYSSERRNEQLVNWQNAPHARFCHPREEHLLPLLVSYAINDSVCSNFYELHVLNKKVSSYTWL